MRALVLAPFDAAALTRLATHGAVACEPWLETGRLWDPEELGARLAADSFDTLIIEADFVTAETFAAAPGLRFLGVCRGDVGPHVDLQAASDAGVLVALTPGRNSIAVAELTVGLMICLARGIAGASAAVHAGKWLGPLDGYTAWRGIELFGCSAGLVGCGSVGSEVARRLTALGMSVRAHEPSVQAREALASSPVQFTDLDDVLRQSRFLSLHAPLSESTRGMIGKRELALMPAGAYLVNTARAALVQEEALLDALRGGHLAGAALDVHSVEPLPPNSPWLELSNVILTPHMGGSTVDVVRHHSWMLVEAIEAWLCGQLPRHLVQPPSASRAHAG